MIIIGVAIIGLLVVLLMRKPKADVDTTKLEERLIRVEGQLDKINPKLTESIAVIPQINKRSH